MIKKILTPVLLFMLSVTAFAQINTFPASESFDAVFTEGQDVVFIPNWTGNRVNSPATATRIFREEVDYNSAPAAISVIPTAAFTGTISVNLDMTGITALNVNFFAKSMSNGAGSRNVNLNMEASIDGGLTWIGNQEVLSLPNEDQTDFISYSYTLPLATANQPNVLLHLLVTRGAGTGTPARLVMDDFSFVENTATVLEASETALNFSQLQGTPSAAQTFTVSAINLTGDLNIAVTTDFEISIDPNVGYSNAIVIPETADFMGPITIYTRLNAATAGAHNGTVTVSSPGAVSRTIELTGDTVLVNVTNPTPLVLTQGFNQTVFSAWDPAAAMGTFPEHMAFWAHSVSDPGLDTPFIEDWHCLYNLTNRSRFVGQGDNGISFVNAANPQFVGVCDGSDPTQTTGAVIENGKAGAVILSLDTSSLSAQVSTDTDFVTIMWTGRTIAQNSRIYGLRMQYRIGDGNGNPNAGWTEFPGTEEYISGATDNFEQKITQLPLECDGYPLVQVRWVYYFISGTGARPNMGIDDIQIDVATTLGTPDLEATKSFGFYPNPANGNMIYFNRPSNVILSDVSGKVICKAENTSEMYVGNLTPGVYFIRNAAGKVLKMVR
ncbi:T9SS type A sorting domain-containing protein [Flavobacterium sp. BFFFF1]|uniref:T9SS type A sorting domain-containing protein n=1 Tax=Flavobacterium sp. BFFFF1 TaxID=2015557 RepID=UPI0025BB9B5F|nr:T9SS type A sorting domain-containing protein [Flavobacterium sp. BFFFF1]